MKIMSMSVGTEYSNHKPGFTSTDIPQYEKGDFTEHRKWSESVKPELDEWKADNEKIRGGNAAVYEEIQQAVSEFGKGNAILV